MSEKPNKNFSDDLELGWFELVAGRLLNNGIHFLSGEIDENNINRAMQWIVYENLDLKKPKTLTLYINSPGGSLNDAFGLIDMMQQSSVPIRTVGIGSVMSAAFLILSSGTKGERYISENASCMCHQFSDEMQGKFHDLKSQVKEFDYTNQRMLKVLAMNTGLTEREVKKKLLPANDIWLQPQELIDLGVVDHMFGV